VQSKQFYNFTGKIKKVLEENTFFASEFSDVVQLCVVT